MDGELEPLLAEQISYYRARAGEYDDAYARRGRYDRGETANAAWLAELAVVEDALAQCDLRGDVLELGAGTGHWTAQLARRAASVTALDAAPEMVAVARDRLDGAPNVTLEVVDLLDGWRPSSAWDAVVACFFIEHVPDERLDGMLAAVRDALRPGGTVFVAEGAYREAPSHVEVRELDGREFRVVERRRRPEELEAAFGRVGIDLAVRETGARFCVGTGTRVR